MNLCWFFENGLFDIYKEKILSFWLSEFWLFINYCCIDEKSKDVQEILMSLIGSYAPF